MYYYRVISSELENLLKEDGPLGWLPSFIKDEREDIDIHIGANNASEWISCYRGLTRVFRVERGRHRGKLKISVADSYIKLAVKNGIDLFHRDIDDLRTAKRALNNFIEIVKKEPIYARYYDNRREGYWQHNLTRAHSTLASGSSEFLILDRESVIGYSNDIEKKNVIDPLIKEFAEIQGDLSEHNKYSAKIKDKNLGNELDCIGINEKGEIILIEVKDGGDAFGIYFAPFQIGMYLKLFNNLVEDNQDDLIKTLNMMLKQKIALGLIPETLKDRFNIPNQPIRLKPVLVIGNYNARSSAVKKFRDIQSFILSKRPDWEEISRIELYQIDTEFNLIPIA
ncbi:hypothetical protein ACFL6E_05085 [Candidatus Neomarinimicrobiota bacterium]